MSHLASRRHAIVCWTIRRAQTRHYSVYGVEHFAYIRTKRVQYALHLTMQRPVALHPVPGVDMHVLTITLLVRHARRTTILRKSAEKRHANGAGVGA